MKIAGIVLAGGASRRMGSPKALLRLAGETFADRLVRVLSAACEPVIVVLGHDAEAIRRGMEREAVVTVNPEPERGQLSSLLCALEAVPGDCGAILFTPVDYPAVDAETVRALAAVMESEGPAVAVPRRGGQHGHPVCVRADVAEEFRHLPGDGRASDVIHKYRDETIYIDVADTGILDDVDDAEAYRRLTAGRESA